MDDSLIGLVTLNLTESVTYDAYRALADRFGSVRRALAAPRRELAAVPGLGPKTAAALRELSNGDAAVEEIEQAHDIGLDVITCEDERYPHNLRFIDDRPIVLYVRGRLTAADAQAISVVGSRRCTPYGSGQADRFAGELAAMGFTIVSGLARGIDAAAHKGALAAGGRTLAVLGSGFVHLYPKRHGKLADRIAERGAVISEFPLDTAPNRWNFPRRNRVVSGLSLGTVVVEAGERSGALITAGVAARQGKEVFALPGRATDRQSWGALRLIRDGATPVIHPADVVRAFPQVAGALEAERPEQVAGAAVPELTEAEKAIWSLLGDEPRHVDEIIAESGMTPSQVLSTLLVLEVKHVVRQHPGKLFSRVRPR
ncbi:MAG: DNA-processing protein DprA [Planctomycetota bacterium]